MSEQREPRHLHLHGAPPQEKMPNPGSAHITVRALSEAHGVRVLGGECRTRDEIDYLIAEIIEDLVQIREAAYMRLDR